MNYKHLLAEAGKAAYGTSGGRCADCQEHHGPSRGRGFTELQEEWESVAMALGGGCWDKKMGTSMDPDVREAGHC